jgi:hypothetical protein
VLRSLSRVARLELVSARLDADVDVVAAAVDRLDVEAVLVCEELALNALEISFSADCRFVRSCDSAPSGDAPVTAVDPEEVEAGAAAADAPVLCREVKSANIDDEN